MARGSWVRVTSVALAAVMLHTGCGEDDGNPGSGSGGTGAGGTGSGGSGGSAAGAGGSSGADAASGGAQGLEGALDAAGFSVQAGAFDVIEIGDCCDPGKSCSGNNPTSPYAALFVPRAEGQTAPNPGELANGTAPSVRLGADEAIVYAGQTPPTAKYFGYTPYLIDRDDGTGTRKPVFASLSETLNNGVIAVESAGDVFAQPMAIVATADATTQAKVEGALVAAGWPASAINSIVFDPATVKLGTQDAADTVGVLFRVALFADAAAGQQFLDAPPGTVLRVTPKTSGAPAPLPAPAARPKNTTLSEAALTGAVDQLEAAVIAANPGFTAKSLFVTQGEPNPSQCIQNLTFCAGDNRDTIYPAILPRVLFEAPDDFYVALGVNHAVTGKVTYSSFSVYAIEHLVGVAAVTSASYGGSAADYLPAHPDVSKLYAWKIARQCGSDPHCLAIPDAGCPTGVGAGKLGNIAFRAYLEPSTNTAPDPSTLVIDRVIRFSKP